MKIYLAARYGRMEELQPYDRALMAAGHETTSQWVWGAEENEGRTPRMNAEMDVADVRRADIVLSFTQDKGSVNKGGGRHWEMGLGYGLGKRLMCVGPKELVFHHLPQVEFYENLDQVIEELKKITDIAQPVFDTEGRDA